MTASFEIEPLPPFDLELTTWTLRRRPDNAFDRWDGATYRRAFVADDGKPFEAAVTQLGEADAPRLRVTLTGGALTSMTQATALTALERLLGIQIDLQTFYGMSRKDELLKPLANQFRGMKPPRLLTPFEALVNAIACQQLTLTVGIRLLNRLTETYGKALETKDGVVHAFPRSQDLANADVEELRSMSFSYQKARYLTNISRLIVNGELNLDEIAQLDDAKAVACLSELKGVGRWTAEYVLLRGLGRTHIFPADDVGARNNLQKWLSLPGKMTYDNTRDALRSWDGFGGLIYFHLLLKSLKEKEVIGG